MSLTDFLDDRRTAALLEAATAQAPEPRIELDPSRGHGVIVGRIGEMDPDALMRQHGLDPAEWEVISCKLNAWNGQRPHDAGALELHQITITIRRRRTFELLLPAPDPITPYQPAARIATVGKPLLWLITTDMQIPFHDEALHQLSCQFAHDNQVDGWLDLGDFLDLPTLSKYRMKPAFHATLNESIHTGSRILHERRSACPPWTVCRLKDGNHDARMDNWVIDHAPALYGLQRAAIGPSEHEAVLSLNYLMRAAERGWRVDTGYPYNEHEAAPGLHAYHGSSVTPGAGNTVRKELLRRDHSLIIGHVNNMAVVSLTRRTRGDDFTVYGYEVGPMCLREGSLGFASVTKDWTPGIATLSVWPDGGWNVELAPFINGELRWRDRAWRSPSIGKAA